MPNAGNCSTDNSGLAAAKGSSRPLQHRGHHVASLLAFRQPETLAQQLLAQQEHNNELQEQLVSSSSLSCILALPPCVERRSSTCLLLALLCLQAVRSSSKKRALVLHTRCAKAKLQVAVRKATR